MKNIFRIFWLVISTTILLPHTLTAQNNHWELKKDASGIKIYVKPVEGSKFKEFRAEMTVTADISGIVATIKDVGKYKEWVEDVKEIELLKSDESNIYYYAESLVPWPLDNRDMVYHLNFVKVNNTEIQINVTGLRNYIPRKEGIVRMKKAVGFWKLKTLEKSKTHITYQLHVEPGGTIPAWLANVKLVDMPFTMLSGLKNALKKK